MRGSLVPGDLLPGDDLPGVGARADERDQHAPCRADDGQRERGQHLSRCLMGGPHKQWGRGRDVLHGHHLPRGCHMRDGCDIVHGEWPHPGNVVSGDGRGAKHGGTELLLHGGVVCDPGTAAHTGGRADADCSTGAR